ncbi:MAG: tetratricopeptide repeat protein [Bdellovibrionales bacterium]|nr:tetratricopeptide repeat protein [Bdellovibrionales bacterium]
MLLIQFTPSAYRSSARKGLLLSTLLLVTTSFLSGCSDPEAKFAKLMADAQENVDTGELESARINLMAAIDLKPKDANAYFKLAEVQVRQGKMRNAVENYTTAINYDPNLRDARLHLASIMLAGRQFEMAESHVMQVLEKDPQDTQAQVLKANIEAMGPRKNRDAARRILNEVIARDAKSLIAIASLANIELADDNEKEAEALYRKALKMEPNNSPVQMALADLYARQGRLDEAQETLENLIEQNPDQSSLRYVFGEFLMRRGLGGEALEQYEQTIAADPERHDARDRLYDMYLARQQPEKATALTAALLQALPDNPGIHYFQGRNLELDNKPEEALAQFLEALKLQNNFAPAFRRAGLLELQLGKSREGMEHLNQAVAIDPGDVGARLALARTLFLREDYAQAREHVEQILRRYPQQLGANILYADIELVEGDGSKARKAYEFLVDSFPENPSGYFKLALLEEKEGNLDKALELYRKTVSFDRGILAPARRLVSVRAQQGHDLGLVIEEIKDLREKSEQSKPEYDLLLGTLTLANRQNEHRFDEAKALFLKALEQKPSLIGAYFALGAIDSVSGDLNSAAAHYQKLLEKNPNHVPTQMLLALTRERMGQMKESADIYRDILKGNSRFAPAANNLAWLLTDELDGNLDEALRLAEIAKEELPKESSVADTLGWVHFRRGSPRAALPLLEEALELHKQANPDQPPNPEILYHLAEVKAAVDEKQDAKRLVAQAMKLGGEQHPKYGKMKSLFESLGS